MPGKESQKALTFDEGLAALGTVLSRRSAARLRDDCAAHQRALAAVKRRSIKLGGPKLAV
jgi:hypothetical protein